MLTAAEQARQERQQLCAALRELVRHEEGLFFLRWLCQMSGIFQAVYPQSHAEAAFREGRRSVGLEVLRLAQEDGIAANILKGT